MNKPRIAAFLFVALFFLTDAISLENVTANGSNYYHAVNNGTVEPSTWLNKSNGLAGYANGNTWADAQERFKWARWQYGYGIINANNFAFSQLTNMSQWNISAFNISDYWQANAKDHEVIGSHAVNFNWQYSQHEFDDYISYHLEVNSTPVFNFGQDTYLAVALLDIDIGGNRKDDTVTFSNTTGNVLHQEPLNRTTNFWSWNNSVLNVQDYPLNKAWHFIFPPNETNFIYLKPINNAEAQVYIGFLIGKTLTNLSKDFIAIDAGCVTSCNGTAGITTNFYLDIRYSPSNTTAQVPINYTALAWVDTSGSGTCSWSPECSLNIQARNPYLPSGLTWLFKIVDANKGNDFINCMTAVYSNPAGGDGCNNGFAQVVNPTLLQYYYFNFTQLGRYSLSLFGHNVQSVFNDGAVSLDLANGTDLLSPNVSFMAANNSAITFYSTNGSLVYVNATINFTGTCAGLCNNSMIFTNQSGLLVKVQTTDLLDWITAKDSYTLLNAQQGKMFRVCDIMNTTNKFSNSTNGAPKMCWQFSVNIAAVPTPTPKPDNNAQNFISLTTNPPLEDTPRFNYFLLLLIPLAFYIMRPPEGLNTTTP